MGSRLVAAVLAAVMPFAAAAQSTPPDTTTATATPPAAKKPYTPHKTPLGKKKTATVAKKPVPPKPPEPPKKPSGAPAVIYDKHGNAIPTSPDAYDVSSATKKK